MAIRCILIDDEPLALAMISGYCQRVPSLQVLGCYTDAIEAAQVLRNEHPELLFLDIEMPDISGIQLARNTGYTPQIIFTTAHSQFAAEGFDLDATDYLLKPYSFERFLQAVEKAKKRFSTPASDQAPNTSTILFKSGYQTIELKTSEILFAQALDNYTIIQTSNKKHIAHSTLKAIEDQLPANQFVRVHRSYLIGRSKIDSFNKSSIQIGQFSIPIGRSYSSSFYQCMHSIT